MSYNGPFLNTIDTEGKLQSSVAPSAGNDLANKTYVDNAIAAGGGDWQASVKEQLSAQPSTPSSGDRYLIGASATGSAWSGKEDSIAEWNGSSWDLTDPDEGMHVFIEGGSGALGGDIVAVYSATAWVKGASLNGALVGSQSLGDIATSGGSVSAARSNLGLGLLAVEDDITLSGSQVSGILGTANGGTGASSVPMVGIISAADASAARTVIGLEIAASRSDSGKVAVLGTISGSPTAVTLDGGGQLVAATLGDAATATVASGLSSTGGNLLRVASSNLASGNLLAVDANGQIVAGTAGGSGTVTSIAISGGSTGLTTSGGPITSSGTITIAGTVAVTAGGTGITSISSGEILYASGSNTIAAAAPGSTSGVQPYDAGLTDIAALAVTDGNFIVGDGTNWVAEGASDARTSLGLGSVATLSTGSTPGSVPTLGSVSGGDIAVKVSSGTIVGVSSFTLSNISDAGGAASEDMVSGLSLTNGRIFKADAGTTTFVEGDILALDSSGTITSGNRGPINKNGEAYTGTSAHTVTPSFAAGPEIMMFDVSGVSSATSTVTLPVPSAADIGKSFEVKVMGGMSSNNKVRVAVSGGGKMDDETTVDFTQNYQRLTFTAFGSTSGGVNYAIG